jgi:hypothetical protein
VVSPEGPSDTNGGDRINAHVSGRFLRALRFPATYHPAVLPIVLIAAGALALVAGAAVLRSLGSGVRIGRLLASVPRVDLDEAVRLAETGESRYVAVHGRIDAEDPFLDVAERPLVYRRTRIEVRTGGQWHRVEESVEQVPFELRDGTDAIGIDAAALDDGLVVVPRESAGLVRDLDDRVPDAYPRDAPARARVDQVSSVEHATVLGWPSKDPAGRTVLTAGRGRPLVVSVLEPDDAMRILAGGDQVRPRLAAALLVAGLALGAIGLAWAGAASIGIVAAADLTSGAPAAPGLAANAPAPSDVSGQTPEPAASGLAGDTRSSGEGPGLVGAPAFAISAVVLIGVVAVGATLLYVRLTGGPRRS